MYYWMLILLMGALPVGSVLIHLGSGTDADLLDLVGRWFVFWAVGVRLLAAGIRQATGPAFTAEILHLPDPKAHVVIRELGFANIAIGTIGVLSQWYAGWVVPAAIAGCLFLGLAGIGHLLRGGRSAKETAAMVSDLAAAVILLVFVALTLI